MLSSKGANIIFLEGYITHDLEMKITDSGAEVITFSIAVPSGFKEEDISFIPCKAWKQSAAYLAQYGHKGSRVSVEGVLVQSRWTDNNGANRSKISVLAKAVSLAPKTQQSESRQNNNNPDFSDNIPF